jgi:putative transposase
MLKAYKYRLYPSEEQKILLEKHFGITRLVYNLALECKVTAYKTHHKYLSRFDLQKQLIELKEEYPWMSEINSQSIQSSLLNLDNAYKRFFKERQGFPNFKKKSLKNSFSVPQNVKIEKSLAIIPKFLDGIEFVMDRPPKGKIKSATISRTPTMKYFISILCETGEQLPDKRPVMDKTAIGIDMGIKDFIVLSNGDKISNPHFFSANEKSIKHLQKELSRKTKRSNRYNKARIDLALEHEKIANKRNDFLHKLSAEITNRFDTICVENLNVRGMVKMHNLSKAISDVSWSSFISMLAYKSEWKGKNFIKIGRFEPSSKTCGSCGAIKCDLQLSDREWVCRECGTIHDRDINAAMNIKNFAIKNLLVGHQLMDVEASSMDDRSDKGPKKYLVDESLKISFESRANHGTQKDTPLLAAG